MNKRSYLHKNDWRPSLQRNQRGLGLATALFVITVMALLAALITQLVRSNASSTQEEILLIRSFYAAESGVQFGLNKAFPPDGAASFCPLMSATTGRTLFTPASMDVDGLNECSASVVCDALEVPGKGRFYTVTSTGTCGEVSRTIQVRAQ